MELERALGDDRVLPGRSAGGGFRQGVGDRNGDGIVTDEEIAEYVSNRVPASVREARQDKQTPLFFRLDSERATRGQFLFVPSPLGVAESAEPGP